MTNREPLDKTYMEIAKAISKRSKAQRKKVGAIVVRGKQIISDGYNGMPATDDSPLEFTDDNGNLVTKPEVLHAEANALMKMVRYGSVGTHGEPTTMYLTLSPCRECAKMILNAGINHVIYEEEYRDLEGIQLLKKYGVSVKKI